MKKWVCPNCESINSDITLCDVCDFENPEYPLVKIKGFSINKETIFEEEEIIIEWDIANFKKLELNIKDEIIDVSKTTFYKYYPKLKSNKKENINFALTIYDALGNKIIHSKELEKEVLVTVKPKTKNFSINKKKILLGKGININWSIDDFSKLELIKNETEKIDVSDITEITLNPIETTSYYIKIFCIDSEITLETEKISVQVFNPITLSFFSDKTYTIQSKPVKISWETENAKNVKIESLFDNHRELPLKGFIESYPSKECEYKITVSNDVETKQETIRVNVFPLPSVEHIIIPSLPQLMGKISFPNIDLSENFLKIEDKKGLEKFYFDKIEKHFIINKFINLYTSGYDIMQKINKKIYD